MPFAAVIYFDSQTEEIIRHIWKVLADKQIDLYLYRSENRPHIKLGMYETVNLEECRKRIKTIADGNRKMEIFFQNIGIFPLDEPIVYLGSAATKQLLDMQIELANRTSDVSIGMNSQYFAPGLWTPDCQLTVGIKKGKLFEAIKIAMEIPIPLKGIISEIGVIEFHPVKKLFAFPFAK